MGSGAGRPSRIAGLESCLRGRSAIRTRRAIRSAGVRCRVAPRRRACRVAGPQARCRPWRVAGGGTASPVAVPRCRIDAAPPDGDPLPRVPRCLGVARCRGRARCQTRWRFTKWVPHHRAALRCRPWRVAGRWRVVRRDAVVPNGCPTARRRSAADRGACRTVMRRQTRCRVAEWRCTCGRRSAADRGVSPGQ